MAEAKSKFSSHSWWFDSHNSSSPRKSPWLQSTLAELDEKTKAMLKLVEEDADSFAQRAEMYYKKRPELINMVEDFYRAHRSLAERYDQVKSESGTRLLTQWASPVSVTKYQPEKSMSSMDKAYDSYSETYDPAESGESDVEDPEEEEEIVIVHKEIEEEISSGVGNEEVMKLTEEIEALKEENRIQKEQLIQKDEEKREVIRQLSLAVEMLKEENVKLRKKGVAKQTSSNNKQSPLEFAKLKESFLGKLFNLSKIIG
ncbi:unnamed protein product [Ilex paraguariensis]|uniref:NAB domain-containing protein n=1 Tax=Ilex paraguariensis TaxID=185542 RepID=A0ABC8U6L3_9AQUA